MPRQRIAPFVLDPTSCDLRGKSWARHFSTLYHRTPCMGEEASTLRLTGSKCLLLKDPSRLEPLHLYPPSHIKRARHLFVRPRALSEQRPQCSYSIVLVCALSERGTRRWRALNPPFGLPGTADSVSHFSFRDLCST